MTINFTTHNAYSKKVASFCKQFWLILIGRYDESLKACQSIDNPNYSDRLILLQAGIKYEQDELHFAKTLLEQANESDPDVIANKACILYKENKLGS